MQKKANLHKQTVQRIMDKKNRSFVERNSTLAEIARWVLLPAVSLISIFTAYPAVYAFIIQNFGMARTAVVGAVIIGLVLEISKWHFVPQAIDDYADKSYLQGSSAKQVFIVKSIMGLLIIAASVSLSLFGASDSAGLYKHATKPIELLTTTAIDAKYDQMIAAENKDIAAAPTWRGVLTKPGAKITRESKAAKMRYEEMRQAEISNIEKKNTETQFLYAQSIDKAGSKFQGLAGIGEIAFLLICIFLVKYENAVIEEAETNDTTPPTEGKKHYEDTTEKPQVWEILKSTDNTGYKTSNTGLNTARYTIHYPENGLPYVLYKGAKRSTDWIDTQISVAQSKLRRNEDKPESVQKRLEFYKGMRQKLEAAQAA